jgi:hypothetical protein
MKLLFPKQNYNVLSPSSYTLISVRDLYISWIGLPILLQGNRWTHEYGNWDWAAQFSENKYINGFFLAVRALKICCYLIIAWSFISKSGPKCIKLLCFSAGKDTGRIL